MADFPCPKCGGRASCAYEGEWGGGVDYCDHYSFRCSRCSYVEEREERVSGPYYGDGLTTCPFCGRSQLEHNVVAMVSPPAKAAPPPTASPPEMPLTTPQKALRLLNQPTPEVETGTDYARPATPFFTGVTEHSSGNVSVMVDSTQCFGTWLFDSSHWIKSTKCILPGIWFFETLERLRPDDETSSEGRAEIVTTDEAWGPDCENPHCDVTREEVPVTLRLRITADLTTMTLTLLRKKQGRLAPFCELRQTETGPTAVSPDTSKLTVHDYIRQCLMNFKLDLGAHTIDTAVRSELTMSGCGWDDGHEWFYRFAASELTDEIQRCLVSKIDHDRITLEGSKFDYLFELDGGFGGPDRSCPNVEPAKAEFEIDISKRQITFHPPAE